MKKAQVNSGRRAASAQLAPTTDKVLVWLHAEVAFTAPPWSKSAHEEAATLLHMVRFGKLLSMPASRPIPRIGRRTHELRIKDATAEWRIIYRIDMDVVLIIEVFKKKTRTTPGAVIKNCKRRLREYDKAKAKT